jgi:hypothetical protein
MWYYMVEQKEVKRKTYVAIMLMGVVSMLGDIVYESGRGIAPDYLYFLGASALLVGLTSGGFVVVAQAIAIFLLWYARHEKERGSALIDLKGD